LVEQTSPPSISRTKTPPQTPESGEPLVATVETALRSQQFAGLTRREKLALLCQYNRDYLQFEAETALDELGWAKGSALLKLIEFVTEKRVRRKNLWAFPVFILSKVSDEDFDKWFASAMAWIREL
jgi:hypothetical protein